MLRPRHLSLRRAMASVIFVGCAFIQPGKAIAQTPSGIAVRFGDHPGFGRVVFDVENGATGVVDRIGDQLIVRVGAVSRIVSGDFPHNVLNVTSDSDTVKIDLVPGAKIRRMLVAGRLVIDVLDPVVPAAPSQRPAGTAVQPPKPPLAANRAVADGSAKRTGAEDQPPAKLTAVAPPKALPPEAAKASDKPHVEQPVATPEPEALVSPSPGDVPKKDVNETAQLVAEAHSAPDGAAGHVLTVPFAVQVGAAAFRRGSDALVVFDERKPIDLQGLKDDPVFGAASIQLLPSATVIRIPLPAAAELRLSRQNEAWVITAIGGDAAPAALSPILQEQIEGKIALPASEPGTVISLPDAKTGGVLMIGTQRVAGQGVAAGRRAPDFELLPSWQGVVVDPLSDAVALHVTPKGFSLGAEGDGRTLMSSTADTAVDAAAKASRMTRIFDLPNLSTTSLIHRMQGAIVAASAEPVQSRSPARRAVAESMVALGLGAEAQSVLGLAASTDARSGDDPTARALDAVAALLGGRAPEAGTLDDPRLDGSDEIAFWRAIHTATMREGSAAAAQDFSSRLPLLMSYPEQLREKLLPIVAETLALGGQADVAKVLLNANKDNSHLDLARAFLRQSEGGPPDDALAAYDRLSLSADRLVRFRAAERGAELRLSSGRATPAQTADTLGKLIYAWRGDDREVDLRLRIAELMGDANQWRPALNLLRETLVGWPDRAEAIKARLGETFAKSLTPSAQASLQPFDLVTLSEENADLMPDGEPGRVLAEHVSDQLLALDLPGRAAPFLEHMVVTSPQGLARATYGARLAALRLEQQNSAGAIDALTATVNPSLPTALLEARTLTFATAVARQGDFESAARALIDLNTEKGDQTLASLAEAAKRWPDAETYLRRYADRMVPDSPAVSEPQARILLRLAGAASQAGDEAMLARLRTHDQQRLPPGKTADLFKLLTAAPVGSVSDLPRSARDIALVSSVRGALPPLALR